MRVVPWVIVTVGLTAIVGPVTAQGPGSIELSALGVWHNKTTSMEALRGFGAGARVGIWLPANFGVEGQLDFTAPRNSSVDNRFQLLYLAASLLYNIPVRGGSLYLRGGYGKLIQQNCVFNTIPCSSHAAATVAAGIRAPLTGIVQLRAEGMVRTRQTYDYTSFGASIGLSFLPGGGAGGGGGGERRGGGGEAGVDSDGDGVSDRRDRCASTQRGALVDSRGCPTDLDGDGVFDGIDRCPATPAGTTVDGFGCPVKQPD